MDNVIEDITNWDTDKSLDIDGYNERWRIKCIVARDIYDSLSEDTQLKVSGMVKVAMSKIKKLRWNNALTLILILLGYQMDKHNCV